MSCLPLDLRKNEDIEYLNLSMYLTPLNPVTGKDGIVRFKLGSVMANDGITFWLTKEGYEHTRGEYSPTEHKGHLTITNNRLEAIQGRVVGLDGKPAKGIQVRASGDGYGFDRANDSTSTDENGEYRLQVSQQNSTWSRSMTTKLASKARDGLVIVPNGSLSDIDFQLTKGTRVFGRLLNEETNEPIADQDVIIYQFGISLLDMGGDRLPNPEGSRNGYVQCRTTIRRPTN